MKGWSWLRFGVLVLVVSVGLVIFGAVATANAQDEPDTLPWQALPGGNSDTAELHLGTFRCVKLNLTIENMPFELEVFAQVGNDRWSYELADILPANATRGTYLIYVHINSFSLKDPVTGNLDPTQVFRGTSMDVRDWGIHAWDPERDAEFMVNDFSLVNDCMVHIAPARS